VAALGDVWIGRLTFALGVSLALAAGLAAMRGRWLWAGLLAAVCAAASPVAGALLGLAALSAALARRSPRALLTLAGPAAAVVLALAALFPEGGYEPYPIRSFAATMVVVLAFLSALPRAARLLRIGAWVYLLACVACLAVHSPIGSNVERYDEWHAYFRAHTPPTLVVWGKNDYIFPSEGAAPYNRDLSDVETHLLDTGHFALETHGEEIASRIEKFFSHGA